MNEQKDRGNHTMKNKRILFVATLTASVILGFSSYGENEAQDEMIAPGDSFFYSRDDHVLEIHFDSDGVCCMLILRTDIPQKLY